MASEDVHESRIVIYGDRSILEDGGGETVFLEGPQDKDAAARYEEICRRLDEGYMTEVLESVRRRGIGGVIPEEGRNILNALGAGVTSNYGRAIVAVSVMQLAVKDICPEQSIRLHKSSNQRNSFSWRQGISMRSIDHSYITPFLRQEGLLKLNADGAMMTRTLAENYPYTKFYKARIQGPQAQWMKLVDALEAGRLDAHLCLEYLLSLLQNKSDKFVGLCNLAMEALEGASGVTAAKVERVMKSFLRDTEYSARAFEIVLHAFMQALGDLGYSSANLEPMSQMRSANKKHGNVGDIETKEGRDILESWDAKYHKPYLIDELNELEDKLETAPRVMTAGFVTDSAPEITDDISRKTEEIADEFSTEVLILSLHDWIDYQVELNAVGDRDLLAQAWLRATVESLTLKRLDKAPIDEPCDRWVEDITKVIKRSFK